MDHGPPRQTRGMGWRKRRQLWQPSAIWRWGGSAAWSTFYSGWGGARRGPLARSRAWRAVVRSHSSDRRATRLSCVRVVFCVL